VVLGDIDVENAPTCEVEEKASEAKKGKEIFMMKAF